MFKKKYVSFRLREGEGNDIKQRETALSDGFLYFFMGCSFFVMNLEILAICLAQTVYFLFKIIKDRCLCNASQANL